MPFSRVWDESCPRVWDQWETNDTRFTVQDLPPEDDEKALEILMEHLVPDEVLCKLSGVTDDPESVEGGKEMWKNVLALRTSLACYAEKNGGRELVAVNACLVKEKGKESYVGDGNKLQNVLKAVEYSESRAKPLEHLGLDKALTAVGLVVVREYRGARLGAKVLAAREPLCRSLGIGGTTTIFTGIASQKLAARCGFHTIFENPISDYAKAGLDYPDDDERIIKIMVKKYE